MSVTTAPPPVRRSLSTAWPWLLALAGPLLHLAQLNAVYLLVPPSCRWGHTWVALAVSAALMAAVVGATAWSWRMWRDRDRPRPERAGGLTGALLGPLFLVIMALIAASAVIVDPCS